MRYLPELLPDVSELLSNPAVELNCKLVKKVFNSLEGIPIEEAEIGMPISIFENYFESPAGPPWQGDDIVMCEISTYVIRHKESEDGGRTQLWCSKGTQTNRDETFFVVGRGLNVEHPTGGPIFKVKVNVSKPMQIVLTKPEWKRITMTKTQELLITESFNSLIDAIKNDKPLSPTQKAYIIDWLEEQRDIELNTAEMVAARSN